MSRISQAHNVHFLPVIQIRHKNLNSSTYLMLNLHCPLCSQDKQGESIAFDVGFTPAKTGGLRRLTRHKALSKLKHPLNPKPGKTDTPPASSPLKSKVRVFIKKMDSLASVLVPNPVKKRSHSPIFSLGRRLSLRGSSPNKILPLNLSGLSGGSEYQF